MISIPLNFDFETQDQADAAIGYLARSFGYTSIITDVDGITQIPNPEDPTTFCKTQIGFLVKQRVINQAKTEQMAAVQSQVDALLLNAKVS